MTSAVYIQLVTRVFIYSCTLLYCCMVDCSSMWFPSCCQESSFKLIHTDVWTEDKKCRSWTRLHCGSVVMVNYYFTCWLDLMVLCTNYRVMHCGAKHGITIACHLSVCNVGGSGPHRLEIFARAISPTPSLFVAQRPSIYSQRKMGKFGGD